MSERGGRAALTERAEAVDPTEAPVVIDLTEKPEAPASIDLTGEPDATKEPTKACTICAERENTHAFVPCGHKAACASCSAKCTRCPICKTPVEKAIKIFDCFWN